MGVGFPRETPKHNHHHGPPQEVSVSHMTDGETESPGCLRTRPGPVGRWQDQDAHFDVSLCVPNRKRALR